MTDRRRPLALLTGAAALLALVTACSGEEGGSAGEWTGGPTLAPSSDAPSASPAPSGSVPVGSGGPVGSAGPGTSSAEQPSAAP